MENLLDIHTNYDIVFKEALQLFEGKTLDFLGLLDSGRIEYSLNTEQTEVIVRKRFADLIFKLSDNTGLHIEMEAHISKSDILRFAIYNIEYSQKFNIPIKTVIFTNQEQKVIEYCNPVMTFKPVIIDLSQRDGEVILEKIRKQIEHGNEVNELEMIYLPLYNKSRTTVELLKDTISLIPKIKKKSDDQQKIILMMLLAANKFLTKDELEKILEENHMDVRELKFIQVLEEIGLKKGLEKGLKEGHEKGLEKGLEEGLEKGLEEGREEGREKGLEEGVRKGYEETAANLIRIGINRELIKEATKLSDEELNELAIQSQRRDVK